MMMERRKRERVSVQFDIDILLGQQLVRVQVINISLTGIFCTPHPLFQKDAPCKVIISLSEEHRIAIDSKILRVGEQGAAISFVEMDEESFVQLMWCSTRTVTRPAAKESAPAPAATVNQPCRYPSDSDKSLMLQVFERSMGKSR